MTITPTPPDDVAPAVLVAAALTDEASFARLYDETSPRIYGLVLRVVRDPVLAEQVTREVYLQAWSDAHGDDPTQSSAISSLMTSAHRHAVDSVRRTEQQASFVTSAVPATPTPPVVEPADEVGTEAARRARQALDRLPRTEREAVDLAYFGGYTHLEVGLLTGTGAHSARGLIRDGLRRLGHDLLEPV